MLKYLVFIIIFITSPSYAQILTMINGEVPIENTPIRISYDGEQLTLSCENISIRSEFEQNENMLLETVGGYRLIFIPVTIGYGGANVFYDLVKIDNYSCYPIKGDMLSNPSVIDGHIKTSMMSAYKNINALYEISTGEQLNIIGEWVSYGDILCVQQKPESSEKIVSCGNFSDPVIDTIKVDKVFLFRDSTSEQKGGGYLIRGDKVQLLDFDEIRSRVKILYFGKSKTIGWIDLRAIYAGNE